MRFARLAGLLLLSAVLGAPARAGWFELGLNSDSVMVSGGTHHGSDPQGRFAFGARGLYSGDYDAWLGAVILRFDVESSGVSGLSFGIGTDILLGTGDDGDVSGVEVAVESSYAPPAWRGAFVGGRLGYAPGIFSWSDTDSLLEWSVRGGYRINPRIDLFVEYRKLEVDFTDLGGRDLDEGAKIGFVGRF